MPEHSPQDRLPQAHIPTSLTCAAKALLPLLVLLAPLAKGEIIPDDRRIQWMPGVPGGIPTYPVDLDAKADCGAVGDGVADDTVALQSCIDRCTTGKAVLLPAGTYRTTAQLSLYRKSIVLRGKGPGVTVLRNEAQTGHAIRIGSSSFEGDSIGVASGATKGSTHLTLATASPFEAGAYVLVFPGTAPAVVSDDGCEGSCAWCSGLGQIVRVESSSGSEIVLARPLFYDLTGSVPLVERFASDTLARRAGVEDLSVEFRSAGSGSRGLVALTFCIECWVKNVEGSMTREAHVRIYGSVNCEVRDSYFHHGHDYVGGQAYGVFLIGHNSDHLVENNIFHVLRHATVVEGGGSGNVFAYNYSQDPQGRSSEGVPSNWLYSDISAHGRHPQFNLWEGNVAARASLDNIWGSSSHNTLFRNWIRMRSAPPDVPGGVTNGRNGVTLMAHNTHENIVGNVIGTEGMGGQYEAYPATDYDENVYVMGYPCDNARGVRSTLPGETVLRHGNFDFVSTAVHWDDSIPDHTLPNSLYLADKPSFFGSKPWPIIGSDLAPRVGVLPAEDRFRGLTKSSVSIGDVSVIEGSAGGTTVTFTITRSTTP